ncbi:MAG TPA: proline racemase family protein [Thermoplasmataceae archaeon]|nr:proline racemase family protein [Thermoplasmataceae archaeon]
MRKRERVGVIDTHTEGEPTRILIRDKLPEGCSNAVEAREHFRMNEDYIRTAILQEPRGHMDQFGSVVYPSNDDETDFTLFFTTTTGYLDMCAHATIGTTTALVFKGLIEADESVRKVRYDTPAGKVEVEVSIVDGDAESVTLRNVPSFSMGKKKVYVDAPVGGNICVDLAFGGNFYAIVDSSELDLEVEESSIEPLRKAGSAISKAVHEQINPKHPENPDISPVPLTMITGKPLLSNDHYRNIVVFPSGSFDRSPCGTGTSARSAVLFRDGALGMGESFVHESITNTTFKCRIVGKTKVGKYGSVIPEVTGRAWVTQLSEIVIDESDPLKHGFLIGK